MPLPTPSSRQPVKQPAAAAPVEPVAPPPAKVEPKAKETAVAAPKGEETCEVMPCHSYPIFIHRQNTLAVPGKWSLVRRDGWVETQLQAKILKLK